MSEQTKTKSQAKGFQWPGNVIPSTHTVHGKITPLKKRVLVENMHFGETVTKAGIILRDDDATEQGVHPRWAQVYAIGKDQNDVSVGEWVLVAHGRWTRGVTLHSSEDDELHHLRMIDEKDILLVTNQEPEAKRLQAGYNNMGGAKQMASLPGND